MFRVFSMVLCLALFTAFPAQSQLRTKPICGTYNELYTDFVVKGIWQVAAVARVGTRQRFGMWATGKGDFLIFVAYADGNTCIMVAGDGLEIFPIKPGTEN